MDTRNWPASARPPLTEPHGTSWYFSFLNPGHCAVDATWLSVTDWQGGNVGGLSFDDTAG